MLLTNLYILSTVGSKVGGTCKAATETPRCMTNAECKDTKCACKADFAENGDKTQCEKSK